MVMRNFHSNFTLCLVRYGLVNMYLSTGKIIVISYKGKSNKNDLSNYTEISLLYAVGKIYVGYFWIVG